MSYMILPGDVVRYSKDYVRPWWETNPRTAQRLSHMRGRVLTVDAHPKGDVCEVRWHGTRAVRAIEARHLRVART